jgi:hypothetical protein
VDQERDAAIHGQFVGFFGVRHAGGDAVVEVRLGKPGGGEDPVVGGQVLRDGEFGVGVDEPAGKVGVGQMVRAPVNAAEAGLQHDLVTGRHFERGREFIVGLHQLHGDLGGGFVPRLPDAVGPQVIVGLAAQLQCRHRPLHPVFPPYPLEVAGTSFDQTFGGQSL